MVTSALVLAVCVAATQSNGPDTILTIMIDDLGFYDTAVYNPDSPTPVLKSLADNGIRLGRHYTYKYCSPTRRSFLTGRLPVHMTGAQAQPCTNWLPLDFTILPQKLGLASPPFSSHVVGKGHWGYQTTDHLPINRGFKSHVGYLCGAENYDHGFNENRDMHHDCSSQPAQCVYDMWHDNHTGADIIADIAYSTNFYSRRATEIINSASSDERLALFLLYQGVHVPYQSVPAWQNHSYPKMRNNVYANMLAAVDSGIRNVTTALRDAGRWNNTLILITADNGGITEGNNYPLRGMKATTWEGGSRVMALVAGGFLEAIPFYNTHLKGTVNNRLIHISDWYATFSTLVGVDPKDDAVYAGVVRPIDGIDVWPLIVAPAAVADAEAQGLDFKTISYKKSPQGHNGTFIAITEATGIWNERYKINQNAQSTHWYTKSGTHILDNRSDWPCRNNIPPSPGPEKCTKEVPGFYCKRDHYCGPSKSFFWSGNLTLESCASVCAQAVYGDCHCFDWQEQILKGVNCRLHHSSSDVERSSENWDAYISNGAEAREWVQTHRAREMVTTSWRTYSIQDMFGQNPSGIKPGTEANCLVCTKDKPCLFDLLADPQERIDISEQNPELVQKLQAALASATSWTINGHMNATSLEAYECVTDTIPWWGNFSGPCCKRKARS